MTMTEQELKEILDAMKLANKNGAVEVYLLGSLKTVALTTEIIDEILDAALRGCSK